MIRRMATTDLANSARAPSLPLSGMLLVKLGRALQHRFNGALKPSELTPRHLQVLDELRQGPMSQQALADRVGVDPTKLVGLLNDLEGQQLAKLRELLVLAAESSGLTDCADAAAGATADEQDVCGEIV